MISTTALTKRFGSTLALNSVTLRFPGNDVVALIGPNGSGKTTLIKSILGLVIPDSGSISIGEKPVLGGWDYRRNIGYMPQISRFPDNMKVGELFGMIRDIRGDEGADTDLMKAFGIETMVNKRMYGLSGGTRQKISACLAFLFRPGILILDEPTAGLDPVSTELFREKIKTEHAAGRLIVITSHVLSELDDLVTSVTFMNEGSVMLSESIATLQQQTGAGKLNTIVARILQQRDAKGGVA
jgi:Cu-processing system ATP-binding protein